MMKRFFAVLLAAALLLTLAACANSMGNAVSDAGRGVGNAVSNVGEGAGDLVSGVGEGIGSGASKVGDFLDGDNSSRTATSSRMDRNDGAVRDENGRIGDEDYEEAHNGVESFVESHQNQNASDLTD